MTTINRADIAQHIGTALTPSDWFEITQDQVNQFADATHDHQFIHVDPVKAADTPFGGPIAHGFLTLSMLSHFADAFSVEIEGQVMLINYGFDKVRFLSPVRVGKKVRAVASYKDIIEKKPGQFMLTASVTVEIEGEEKPALMADWITMQFVK